MGFETTAINVLVLVAMAIPGFILVKAKVIKENGIPYFSAVLLYVAQPFLTVRSFLTVQYSTELLENMGIAFAVSILCQLGLFLLLWLILRKKFDKPEDTKNLRENGFLDGTSVSSDDNVNLMIKNTRKGRAYRVVVLASAFGNIGFFGIPILQMMFPLSGEPILYAAIFSVTMNLLGWTLGVYVLTGDKKYISLKKAIFNPLIITLIIALPLFFTKITLNSFPSQIIMVINFLADMTAPLCMLGLGMRFALAPIKELFLDWRVYVVTILKNLFLPIFVFLVLMPFEMDVLLRATLVLMASMPCASMNLGLSELYSGDQKTAANSLLMSTIFSILTIPLIALMLPQI